MDNSHSIALFQKFDITKSDLVIRYCVKPRLTEECSFYFYSSQRYTLHSKNGNGIQQEELMLDEEV